MCEPAGHTAFLAWWAAQPPQHLAAVWTSSTSKSKGKNPLVCGRALGLCLGCQSVAGVPALDTRPAASTLTPEDLATPDALASWRSQHVVDAAPVPGVCGPSVAGHRRARDCALWLGDVSADALASFAVAKPSSLVMSTPSFGAALQTYLSQRLLCKECRLHVQGAWAAVQQVHARCAASGHACGCTPDFCTALADDTEGAPGWWPHGTVSLNAAGHLTGRWDTHAWPAGEQPPVFSWSVGTSSGCEDVHQWTPTEHDGADACIDALVALPERDGDVDEVAVDVYINVRATFPDGTSETASCPALRMDGKECVHLRMVFNDAHGTVGLTTETEEDMRCFMQYARRLQQEDEAEMEADLVAPPPASSQDLLPGSSAPGGAVLSDTDDAAAYEDAHVDTPELAAEALLDAACVIIKQRAEHAYRRAAAAAHVQRLMAAAQAEQAEQALRTAYREVHAEAQAAQLLAELELESAAAKKTAASTPGKRGKKAKQSTPPASRVKAAAEEPDEPLATPPQAPATPPVAPVTPRMQQQQQADDAALPASPQTPTAPLEAGEWSEQTSRRRRRLSNASRMSNGSRESLVSAGEEGSHMASPGRVSPVEGHAATQPLGTGTLPQPQPQQKQPVAARQVMSASYQLPPPPPAASPQWSASQQVARRWPPPSAPPLPAPPSMPLPPLPRQQQVPEAASSAFASSGAPAHLPVRALGSSTAAFYTGFGLFQLPIGGGNGQQGNPF